MSVSFISKFTYFAVCSKFLFVLAILSSFSLATIAQDIIIQKDGTEIKANVKQIKPVEVMYTRDNTETPIYYILKSDIEMIKYEDGTEETFRNVNAQNLVNIPQRLLNKPSNPYEMPYKYTFGRIINPIGGSKSAWGVGVASFFIPGLGQFINGDIEAGLVFLSTSIATNSIWMYAYDDTLVKISFGASVLINISSVINAVSIANKVNITRGFRLTDNSYLRIEPTLLQTADITQPNQNNHAYGMRFRVSL